MDPREFFRGFWAPRGPSSDQHGEGQHQSSLPDRIDPNDPHQMQKLLEAQMEELAKAFGGPSGSINPGTFWGDGIRGGALMTPPSHPPSLNYDESLDGKLSEENFDDFVASLKQERERDKIMNEGGAIQEFSPFRGKPQGWVTTTSISTIRMPDGSVVTEETRRSPNGMMFKKVSKDIGGKKHVTTTITKPDGSEEVKKRVEDGKGKDMWNTAITDERMERWHDNYQPPLIDKFFHPQGKKSPYEEKFLRDKFQRTEELYREFFGK